ncbi:MAG: TolC family protein [Thermoanaerobaculia bacterium]|nr:TolC family protein [Thermoanaerobaculia bacterium]
MLDLLSLRPLAVLLLVVPPSAVAQEAQAISTQSRPRPELTLEAALVEAFTRSPTLASAAAEVEEARGHLLAARTFPYNPELDLDVAERKGLAASSTDRGVGLTQQLEIGGQRSKRVSVAELEFSSVEARFQRERRLLAASVSLAFAEAVATEELAALAETEAELARELLTVTQRRFEAGAATQVDFNLARVSTARSERRAGMARAATDEARSRLAEAVGLDPAAPPNPMGPLGLPAGEPAPLAELVQEAMAHRADLQTLVEERLAAEARLGLTRAERIPDLAIGTFYGEEEADRILGVGVAIAIPLFNRNRGEIAEASAALERAAADVAGQNLAVRREVFSTLSRYEAARGSAEQLGEQVVGSLAESLGLLERSFTAGKIGLSDLLVFRRELIEARREHIEATAEAWMARIALDLAVGRLPVPASASPKANSKGLPPTDPSSETDQ